MIYTQVIVYCISIEEGVDINYTILCTGSKSAKCEDDSIGEKRTSHAHQQRCLYNHQFEYYLLCGQSNG